MGYLLVFGAGIGVGWLLFKQPQWVKDKLSALWTWIKSKTAGA